MDSEGGSGYLPQGIVAKLNTATLSGNGQCQILPLWLAGKIILKFSLNGDSQISVKQNLFDLSLGEAGL